MLISGYSFATDLKVDDYFRVMGEVYFRFKASEVFFYKRSIKNRLN